MISITATELQAIREEELDALAAASARALIAQGWTADPGTYDIGVFTGDLEAAEALCEHPLDREETTEHEARIRKHLTSLLG